MENVGFFTSLKRRDSMQKPIGSRKDFSQPESVLVEEFTGMIQDILHIDDVQQLADYYQHCKTSRLQHCINVAYYTFLITRKLNLDVRSATRAALLHDFYLYDWRHDEQPVEGRHSAVHPQIALEMARQHTEVNAIMEDCILHHMWPMTRQRPETPEAWVVQGADKLCAVMEMSTQSARRISPVRLKALMVSTLLRG